jgi:hypothetical protein
LGPLKALKPLLIIFSFAQTLILKLQAGEKQVVDAPMFRILSLVCNLPELDGVADPGKVFYPT